MFAQVYAICMAPKPQISSALELQTKYSELLTQAPYVDAHSPFLLHKVLSTSFRITAGVVKQWWSKYRVSEGEVRLTSAAELEELYGETIRHYALEHPTAFKLCKALRERSPPICISDSGAKQWLRSYGGQAVIANVNSAGHLEMRYGDRIRTNMPFNSPDALASWLLSDVKVSAPARVCQHWLNKDWSSSGKLLSIEAVDEHCGERLRLDQYRHCFLSDESAQTMAEILKESSPPFTVSALLLRQWYVR